eukprot:TRINITY_DN7027_c0_g1_i4.p1 TRINITY_DN7027_c0_g1~~TRINITY_DN7027_c0_g1_i4.p1  ORF type:complete len:725 (+),score=109.40 TRINITY_DN7027_c0_g1_i4:741-2915(+)
MPKDGNSVTVVVRVRPQNKNEKAAEDKKVTSIVDGVTVKMDKDLWASERCGTWTFDKVFDTNAEQSEIYTAVGDTVLQSSFNGYNTSIFAYGQTGSGKTYTMMGVASDDRNEGLIPRICKKLFSTAAEHSLAAPSHTYTATVSYLEIYMEKVNDLIDPSYNGRLKVREHPVTGPYVENLAVLQVMSYDEVASCIEEGNKLRHVASTNMNDVSSRSHAVFTIEVTHTVKTVITDEETVQNTVSKIVMVDLAGSERQKSTGAVGSRLAEGSQINKSLTTLGLVINSLADLSTQTKTSAKHIPYRDSTLTWLIKDALGGNSKTFMISTISPSLMQIDETVSTLRYADRAKSIVTKAVVNEDPVQKIIKALQAEIEIYREQAQQYKEKADQADITTRNKLKHVHDAYKTKVEGFKEKIRTLETTGDSIKTLQQNVREKQESSAGDPTWEAEKLALCKEINDLKTAQREEFETKEQMWAKQKERLQTKAINDMEDFLKVSLQAKELEKELQESKRVIAVQKTALHKNKQSIDPRQNELKQAVETLLEAEAAWCHERRKIEDLIAQFESGSEYVAGSNGNLVAAHMKLLEERSAEWAAEEEQLVSRVDELETKCKELGLSGFTASMADARDRCRVQREASDLRRQVELKDQQLELYATRLRASSRCEPIAWAPDSSSHTCTRCSNLFTLLTRRHHCRKCGKLVCAKCSPLRMPVPSVTHSLVRVCLDCGS